MTISGVQASCAEDPLVAAAVESLPEAAEKVTLCALTIPPPQLLLNEEQAAGQKLLPHLDNALRTSGVHLRHCNSTRESCEIHPPLPLPVLHLPHIQCGLFLQAG